MREQAVFAALAQWLVGGQPAYLCSVLSTWGSSPRPVGSLLASNGREFIGSLSGGCIEDDLIARLAAGEFTARATIERYGERSEQAARLQLPCGGVLTVLIERLSGHEQALCAAIAERLLRREQLLLQRDYRAATPWQLAAATLETPNLTVVGTMDSGVFCGSVAQHIGPHFRLLLIGATEVSRAVAQLAQWLDYEVVVADPDEQRIKQWDLDGCQLHQQLADDVVLACANDPRSAILALTHDPRVDDMALLEAFNTPAFYIGAMGSLATSVKRRQRLLDLGVAADDLQRLRAPIGLDIGSKTPMEIAVAIIAELTLCRRQLAASP